MGTRRFLLPDAGEGLTEAEIVRWHVQPGSRIEVNQPLVEIETAKAVVELPSPFAGVVTELLVEVGRTVPVGTPIVSVEVEQDDDPDAVDEQPQALLVGYGVAGASASGRRRRVGGDSVGVTATPAPRHGVLAKPPVRHLAARLGIDLTHVAGSGPGGIVTREDVQRTLQGGNGHGPRDLPVVELPGDQRTAASGVHKAMAEAMTRSVSTIPQAAVWVDVDVSGAFVRLDAMKSDPAFEGVRVTPLLLVADALLRAAVKHPLSAAVWDPRTQELVQRGEINLGIAVASPRGLIVPNVRSAQSMELPELARALSELTETARAGRTGLDDMRHGTMTITNVGVLGVDGGVPIVNPGESVILAVGQARPVPRVVDGEVAVRTVMTLTLSFDHRVLDGAAACAFLRSVADHLEGS